MKGEAAGYALLGASHGVASARSIDAARWAAIVAACTVMVAPTLANVAIVVMLVCPLASGQVMARLRHAITQPLVVGVAIVVVMVALGMLWSSVPWIDRLKSFYSWRKLWIIPTLLVLFGPPLWKQRMIAAYVAVCAAAAVVSFGLVAVAGHLPDSPSGPSGSLFRNHSTQSMAFATGAFLSLWAASRPQLSKRVRLAALGASALLALNIAFVTPGRSGYLALAVMLLVTAAANLRGWRNKVLVAALGALFAGALAMSPLARDRLDHGVQEWNSARTAQEYSSMGIRAVFYENTVELIRERPWFGVGSGAFGEAYTAHVRGKYTDWRAMPSGDPHNQYLYVLAEQGIVGLIAFLSFIALALADRGDRGPTRLIAIGMLLAWCATSMLSSHFQTFSEGHLLAFFLAAMLARPVPGLDPGSPVPPTDPVAARSR